MLPKWCFSCWTGFCSGLTSDPGTPIDSNSVMSDSFSPRHVFLFLTWDALLPAPAIDKTLVPAPGQLHGKRLRSCARRIFGPEMRFFLFTARNTVKRGLHLWEWRMAFLQAGIIIACEHIAAEIKTISFTLNRFVISGGCLRCNCCC